METFKISLAQLEVKLAEPESNVARAMQMIDQAANQDSRLVLLPELWHSGYDLEHLDAYAQIAGRGLWDQLQNKARQCCIAIGGSIIEKSGGQYFNTFLLFDDKGSLAASYRKIHLFRLLREEQFLTPGDTPVLADPSWGKTGLATCYDLRFPELFRTYTLAGASLILLPAEWPLKRLEHWRTLLCARAIENQLFVAAVNAAGVYRGDLYAGHSMVINPWGEVLAEAGQEEQQLAVDIDLAEIEQIRARIPVLKDRRPEVYRLD